MNKEKIGIQIDKIEKELINISNEIHSNPELSFEEYKAKEILTQYLKSKGFKIKENLAGLETSFIASMGEDKDKKTLAFLAEYDALPEIGHGCGHNLIAAISTGALVGLSKVKEDLGANIVLIGTPAEEAGGGKIIMEGKGVFENIDYALMMHPACENLICRGGLATRSVKIEYFGKAAHSSTPEDGINALQGVIQTFNLIDSFMKIFPLKTNINGIITSGGKASNVITDYASCEFTIRNETVHDLNEVVGYLDNIVDLVDNLLGTKSKIEKGLIYSERYVNKTIDEKLKENIKKYGIEMNYPDENMKLGSSDIGNISLKIPSIHSYIKISEEYIQSHSKEFTEASKTNYAHKQMIKASKALAETAYDILTDKNLQSQIQKEFDKTVPKYSKDDLK